MPGTEFALGAINPAHLVLALPEKQNRIYVYIYIIYIMYIYNIYIILYIYGERERF